MFFLLPQLTTDYQCRSALILHPETCSPRCRILLLSYQQQPQNWLPAKVKPDKLWIHEALQSFRIEPDSYEVWACFYSFQLCFLQLPPSVLIFTPISSRGHSALCQLPFSQVYCLQNSQARFRRPNPAPNLSLDCSQSNLLQELVLTFLSCFPVSFPLHSTRRFALPHYHAKDLMVEPMGSTHGSRQIATLSK